MGRLIAHRADQHVDPLFPGEPIRGPRCTRPSLALAIWIGCIRFRHERAGHAAVHQRLVVGQFDVGPDAAGQRPLMFVDEPFVDVDLLQARRYQACPVLAALVLFVERDRHQVDELHRAGSLQPGLDQFALVGPHDPFGDGLFDSWPGPHRICSSSVVEQYFPSRYSRT